MEWGCGSMEGCVCVHAMALWKTCQTSANETVTTLCGRCLIILDVALRPLNQS